MRKCNNAVLILFCVTLTGCFSFSSYQTARMLEPEQASVTISYNQNESRNEEDSGIRSNIIEGQIRLGMTDKIEAGIKYGRHSSSWRFQKEGEEEEVEIGDINFNFTSVDAKFSILPNHIAFSIPLGFFWTTNDEENDEMEEFLFQLQPGFIFSYQSQPFEITGAVKYLIFTEEDNEGFDSLLAFNLGLGFSNNFSRWIVGPEIGFLLNPKEVDEGYFFQYGIGVSIRLSPETSKDLIKVIEGFFEK